MSQRFIFRLAVVLLILIGMLAPPRLVFACQEEGHKQYTCCCHKEENPCRRGSCKHRAKAQQASCCEVSQEAGVEAQAPTGQIGKLLYAPQAPPVFGVKENIAQPIFYSPFVFLHYPPAWFSGIQTYLTTLRLRI